MPTKSQPMTPTKAPMIPGTRVSNCIRAECGACPGNPQSRGVTPGVQRGVTRRALPILLVALVAACAAPAAPSETPAALDTAFASATRPTQSVESAGSPSPDATAREPTFSVAIYP